MVLFFKIDNGQMVSGMADLCGMRTRRRSRHSTKASTTKY